MRAPNLEHEVDLVNSFDLSLIAARRMGAEEGTPLLIASAVGANLPVWRRALIDLARARPVVTWDLRGLGESGTARSQRVDSGAHAEDGIAVADSYGIDRFHLAGWSTGARIALEIAHRYPEKVVSMTLVCGGYGYSMPDGLRHLELASLLPLISGVAKHFSGYAGAALRALTGRAELPGLIRQSGMIGPTADTTALVDMLRSMSESDTRTLLETYEAVAGDAQPELLAAIEASTLLVAGERDPFTPRRSMEVMKERIPGASLTVYDRATHYLPIEFPARLASDMGDSMSESARPRLG
ncbi:MAG: alpha/beta fold hydrolase [Actinomycetota bacterium]